MADRPPGCLVNFNVVLNRDTDIITETKYKTQQLYYVLSVQVCK